MNTRSRILTIGAVLSVAGCVRPTYLGGAAIRPEEASPIHENHSLVRGRTTYTSPSRVTAQANAMSIEALAAYECPGNRIPCRPATVKLTFELVSSKLLRVPIPQTASAVIDGATYRLGDVSCPGVDTTPYGQQWRPPHTFHVEVTLDRFAEMSAANEVVMDFGRFNFKLSDRVLSGFRRMHMEMPVREAVAP